MQSSLALCASIIKLRLALLNFISCFVLLSAFIFYYTSFKGDFVTGFTPPQLIFSPSIDPPQQCVIVNFRDDDLLVEEDEVFVVTFVPTNPNDMFMNGNNVTVVVVDDESKYKYV